MTTPGPRADGAVDAPTEVLQAVRTVPTRDEPSADAPSAPAPARPAPARPARGGRTGRPSGPTLRNGLGTPALVLGVLAVGTCWTGWAGVVLGLFAVAAGFLGARRGFHGQATDGASSLGGFALGAIGLVVGAVVVGPTLFGTGNFGDGLTLDQCMAQSHSAFAMHMCKSQHLTEFNQRFPDAAQ